MTPKCLPGTTRTWTAQTNTGRAAGGGAHEHMGAHRHLCQLPDHRPDGGGRPGRPNHHQGLRLPPHQPLLILRHLHKELRPLKLPIQHTGVPSVGGVYIVHKPKVPSSGVSRNRHGDLPKTDFTLYLML